MSQACAVHSCGYAAEALIEDFPVCALHDARQTRGILELGELPCAASMHGRPIVYRGGIQLAEEHFEPRESLSAMKAFDDPRMLSVPTTPTRFIHPNYNLTAP